MLVSSTPYMACAFRIHIVVNIYHTMYFPSSISGHHGHPRHGNIQLLQEDESELCTLSTRNGTGRIHGLSSGLLLATFVATCIFKICFKIRISFLVTLLNILDCQLASLSWFSKLRYCSIFLKPGITIICSLK